MTGVEEYRKKILCISVMQSWGGGEEFILKLHQNLKQLRIYRD